MQPIGKTYLIQAEKEIQETEGNIIIPDTSSIHDIYYKGIIKAYGTSWTDEELKTLVPIGSKVVMKYNDKSKSGIKLVIKNKIYYIYDSDHVIAVLEDE